MQKQQRGSLESDFRPYISENPSIFILVSFSGGLLFWVIDSLIDVYYFNEYEKVYMAIFFPEGSELIMRLLVVAMLSMVGIFARRSIMQQNAYNVLMKEYQDELVKLVEIRTEELELKTSELQQLADKDPLTNVFNRRRFLVDVVNVFNLYKRYNNSFSVMMIDIDNFKMINDKHGHDAGDNILVAVTELIHKAIRGTDILARWGGEEFIICLPETEEKGACILAKKIVELINAHNFYSGLKATISAGVSMVAEDDENISAVVKRADKALYLAKDNGKNQYQYLS